MHGYNTAENAQQRGDDDSKADAAAAAYLQWKLTAEDGGSPSIIKLMIKNCNLGRGE